MDSVPETQEEPQAEPADVTKTANNQPDGKESLPDKQKGMVLSNHSFHHKISNMLEKLTENYTKTQYIYLSRVVCRLLKFVRPIMTFGLIKTALHVVIFSH